MHAVFRSAARAPSTMASAAAAVSIGKEVQEKRNEPGVTVAALTAVLTTAPPLSAPDSLAQCTWVSSAKITKAQKLAIERVQGSVRRGSTGLPATQVRDAMVRAVASLPMAPTSLEAIRATLQRELAISFDPGPVELATNVVLRVIDATLLAELSPLVQTRVATQAPRPIRTAPAQLSASRAKKRKSSLVAKKPVPQLPTSPMRAPLHEPEPKKPLDVPVTTVTISPSSELPDPQAALHLLQNTDLVREFGTVLETLTVVLRALHSGGQTHVTGLFLDAIANRSALVIPTATFEKSRRMFRPPATALDAGDRHRSIENYSPADPHTVVIASRAAEARLAWEQVLRMPR